MENNDLQVNVILVDLLMNLYHLSVISSFCPVASTKKTVKSVKSALLALNSREGGGLSVCLLVEYIHEYLNGFHNYTARKVGEKRRCGVICVLISLWH